MKLQGYGSLRIVLGVFAASVIAAMLFSGLSYFHGDPIDRVVISGFVGGIVTLIIALYSIFKSDDQDGSKF
jgi:hypothetical protein